MKRKFPKPGARIIKSSIAVSLCMMIYFLRTLLPLGNGIPFYSALAALWCMQPYQNSTKEMALQRSAGTLIGAVYGLIILVFIQLCNVNSQMLVYFTASVMLIPVLYTTVVMNKKNASFFSCVVFLSIVLTHSFDENPYLFVLNRILDTFIGIAVGVGVNEFRLPVKHDDATLFISGIDSVLISDSPYSIPYSKVELNRLIAEGMNFTISTIHTPSELIPLMAGVNLKLPVIVMDGAALYDISDNTYLETVALDNDVSNAIVSYIRAHGFECFVSALYDHTLLNYYDGVINEGERSYFEKQKKSPYCNYVHCSFRNKKMNEKIICISVIEKSDRIMHLKKELEKHFNTAVRIAVTESDCEHYLCLKIYSSYASKNTMIEKIRAFTNSEKTITFGSIKGAYDIYIEDGGGNNTIKKLKKLFRSSWL
ncbi:MAG: HAD hydrolase family protein [Oscillospiraceae bacterium]|nr:HAD hydrolase family protein [Oscillospiraceae bacterium]